MKEFASKAARACGSDYDPSAIQDIDALAKIYAKAAPTPGNTAARRYEINFVVRVD